MTTIKLSGGDLGCETMFVRCDLSQAAAPIMAQYNPGDEWAGSQYQCADARHTTNGLVEIGKTLAARACEMPSEQFDCDWEEIV